MATDVWVTGMSLCSALGPTLAQSWEMLLQGTCGLKAQKPYGDLPSHLLGTIADSPTRLTPLLSHTLQALIADARLLAIEGDPFATARWGFAVGSSRGYQADLERLMEEREGNANVPDARWLNLYGRSPASQVVQELQRSGPILSPRAACATGIWAIAQGLELIRTGQCDIVIAGAAEAPITPLALAGFQNMGALAKTGVFPFDLRRTGFGLAEGAALLVLERRDHAERRGVIPYGQVLSVGLTNDAYHCSAPDPNRSAALSAIQTCLDRSNLRPRQVGYIHAHGTGTALNDEREAALIQDLFPQETTAVSSSKGATGHTLGASGALGAVFCLMALYKQILPPCTGLIQPAYDLNWVVQAQPTDLEAALCFSFGFGGQNAAIAFARIADQR